MISRRIARREMAGSTTSEFNLETRPFHVVAGPGHLYQPLPRRMAGSRRVSALVKTYADPAGQESVHTGYWADSAGAE
jgi:hypothetical protein